MNSKQDQASEELYVIGTKLKLKYIALAFVAVMAGIVLNFPLNNFIVTQVAKLLAANQRQCPISYERINFSLFFFPTLSLDGLNVDGRCFGQPGNVLKLGNTEVSFMGPHFIPVGARLHASTHLGKAVLPIRMGIGPTSSLIKIPEITLKGKDLIDVLPGFRSYTGDIQTELLVKLAAGKIESGNVLLESKNFGIPAQNIMGLAIGDINFGNMTIKARVISAAKAEIEHIILGNDRSPLYASLKGNINLVQPQMSYSALDLSGQVRFSDEFIKQFPIINLLISGKKSNNGLFTFAVKGTVGSPQFKFN